jgi:hypothetical protein
VRELCGDDGDKIASFLLDVLNGAELDGVKPKLAERLEAARILLERGWGKTPIAIASDGEPTKFVLISAFAPKESSDRAQGGKGRLSTQETGRSTARIRLRL